MTTMTEQWCRVTGGVELLSGHIRRTGCAKTVPRSTSRPFGSRTSISESGDLRARPKERGTTHKYPHWRSGTLFKPCDVSPRDALRYVGGAVR